jgi:DNA-binding MarR family transcriptional regulator
MTAGSKARLRLWLRLLKATRAVEAELRERLRAEFGQTLPRFDVMAALARRPEGLRMSEISGMLRVSNGNVTPIVDRLVAEGLAERRAVEGDRRATRVRLTAAGRTGFAAQAEAHEGWLDAMLAGVSAEEAAALSATLARVGERVEP